MSAHSGDYLDDRAAAAASQPTCDACGDTFPLDALDEHWRCEKCAEAAAWRQQVAVGWAHVRDRGDRPDDDWAEFGVAERPATSIVRTTERHRTRDGGTYQQPAGGTR